MKGWKCFALISVLSVALPLLARSGDTSSHGGTGKQGKKAVSHAAYASDGERIFDQNCSRCHNAPQGFPPAISGTIVRHMRVRASLSKKDEEALLRFFNPQ